MKKNELVITLAPTVAQWVRVEWLLLTLVAAWRVASGPRATIAALRRKPEFFHRDPFAAYANESTCRAHLEHEIARGNLATIWAKNARAVNLIDLVAWAASRNIRVEQEALPGCQSFVEEAYQQLRIQLASAQSQPLGASKMQKQEEAVLSAIRLLGHDPMGLPRHKSGTAGVRSEAAKRVNKDKDLFCAPTSFGAAWSRLSVRGRIKYRDEHP